MGLKGSFTGSEISRCDDRYGLSGESYAPRDLAIGKSVSPRRCQLKGGTRGQIEGCRGGVSKRKVE